MKTLDLTLSDLSFDDQWDVIVIGGGPAGCGAALAAARGGTKVLLIDSSTALGGNMTTGLVTVWGPFSDDHPTPDMIYHGGLALEIMSECKKGMPHVPADALNWVPVDPEYLKRIYDRKLTEAGVTVLFETSLASVQVNDQGVVESITTCSKAGLQAWGAKFFIDASGDCDLSARAGATALKGETDDKLALQPVTLCFIICNVDDYAYRFGPRTAGQPGAINHQIVKSGKYPEIKDPHCCHCAIGPGTYAFNAGHVWDVDGTEPESVSQALMEGRRIAAAWLAAFKEFHPSAFGNAFLVATAPRLGVRETRRIVGDYYLTVEDYLSRRWFDDDIAHNHYWIDLHTTKSEIKLSVDSDLVTERFEHFKDRESHGIPFRCLLPKGLSNVMMAGRAISADRCVLGAIRTMPCSMNMGEAAGTAAAQLVAKGSRDTRTTDIKQLRKTLQENGAYLPDSKPEAVAS